MLELVSELKKHSSVGVSANLQTGFVSQDGQTQGTPVQARPSKQAIQATVKETPIHSVQHLGARSARYDQYLELVSERRANPLIPGCVLASLIRSSVSGNPLDFDAAALRAFNSRSLDLVLDFFEEKLYAQFREPASRFPAAIEVV
jgi:hypothetical protein